MILELILPIFLVILVGFVLGNVKVDLKPFINLIIYITVPALILTTVTKAQLSIGLFTQVAFAALLIIAIQWSISIWFLMFTKSNKDALLVPSVMGNTGYLGYPMALALFGSVGLSLAIGYDIIMALFFFTFGVWSMVRRGDVREVLKLPLIYAMIISLVLNVIGLQIPAFLFKPLEMIGLITIPLALLILGYCLRTKVKLSSAVFLGVIYRIGGGLLIALLVVWLLNLSGIAKSVVILQAIMPSPIMAIILAKKYNNHVKEVSSIVLLTTLLSMFTIPIIMQNYI